MARDQFGYEAHWRKTYDPMGVELFFYRNAGEEGRTPALIDLDGVLRHVPKVVPHDQTTRPLLRTGYEGLVILEAAHELYTATAHDPGTEAKVLREWLGVERGRVDRALESSPSQLALRALGG